MERELLGRLGNLVIAELGNCKPNYCSLGRDVAARYLPTTNSAARPQKYHHNNVPIDPYQSSRDQKAPPEPSAKNNPISEIGRSRANTKVQTSGKATAIKQVMK